MPYQEPGQPADDCEYVEVWIDSSASPPYVLLLLGDYQGLWSVIDPAEGYRTVLAKKSYEEAKLWLLEDEYEAVRGRMALNDEVAPVSDGDAAMLVND